MKTTWILFIAFTNAHSFNGPLVVDNLISYAECARVDNEIRNTVTDSYYIKFSKCIEVRK